MTVAVDGGRLSAEIEELAQFSDSPYPSVTRVLFTDADLAARDWLVARFEAAGLDVRADAVGNVFARWPGGDLGLPAVATGSHADAIPDAGRFDGTLGVLGGLEAIRALRAAGLAPRRSIELILFTAEEPTRFAMGCLGSRLLAGNLPTERADALTGEDGVALREARDVAGYTGDLATVRLPREAYAAFVELHIEQGPILEAAGDDIGVVTAITAPATLRVTLTGPGGHAGGVLMADRHDPMIAAADVILTVDRAARAAGRPDTVGTCGLVHVEPGAVNSIARLVRLDIDVRDTDAGERNRVLEAIRATVEERSAALGVGAEMELLNADAPTICDPAIVAAAEAACRDEGVRHRRMVSRAYHDSSLMSLVCPTGMIFIPCRDGISHRPEEHASLEHMARGAAVLAGTLARLAG